MNLYVLDQNFSTIKVLDRFESLLWVERYNEPGDFEIYTAVTEDMLTYPVVDNYIYFGDSDKLMIVEDIKITTNTETGNHIQIKGRSLESILDRRCILGKLDVTGNLQDTIQSILNTNIISPTDTDRAISNFIFTPSTDTAITELTYDNQFENVSVLEAVQDICKSKNIGFRVKLNSQNQFEMELYHGTDRSYNQTAVPRVVFSPSFDNIVSSDYVENHSNAKTFCYVHTVYYDNNTETEVTRTAGSGTGLMRKEMYVPSSISKEEGMTLEDFYAKLDNDASASLSESKVKKSFEGACETSRTFKYKRDFFLGDICHVANEYGFEATSRVEEYLWSISDRGTEDYPKFTAINE